MQHGLKATVVEHGRCHARGAGRLADVAGIAGWVPCDVTEQRPARAHPLKSEIKIQICLNVYTLCCRIFNNHDHILNQNTYM